MWETVSGPSSYEVPNTIGNALANLVPAYQQAQANNYRSQEEQILLDQQRAFKDGVPMNPDGTPNYSEIMRVLGQKGSISAIQNLAPLLQDQQWQKAAGQPSPLLSGGYATGGAGGGYSASGGGGSVVDQLAENLASRIESGGKYDTLGPVTKSGDRAYGKYQVMGANVAPWTREILGHEMTPEQFLADPAAQDAVARGKLGQYLQQTGNPRDAASMWFTGKPLSQGAGLADQNGMTGARYADIATRGIGGSAAPGAGTRVASAGASDARSIGYTADAATPETPRAPPVSASAGSTLPRAIGSGAGAPAAPAGQAGAPGAAPVAVAAAGGAPAVPVAPAAPAAASTQPNVAAVVTATLRDPAKAAQIAPYVAKALKVPPDAPLTAEQIQRAQSIVTAYMQRTGQKPGVPGAAPVPGAPGGQPPAQPGAQAPVAPPPAGAAPGQPPQPTGPIGPQVPLPRGFTDPQKAILAIDQEIARMGANPYARGQVAALTDWRDRIAASTAPIQVGGSLIDPRSGQTLLSTNANNIALQRFLEQYPDATAEQIQQFMQQGRGARSGEAMFVSRYVGEHPEATAEEIMRAVQDYKSGSTALTRFTSGKEGGAVRSFNVLVDHLGTLQAAADALKNGDAQLFNRAAQFWNSQTGNPAPTNFDATKQLVGDEIVKAIVGGAAALGDREAIKATINRTNSPAQLAGVIEQYKKLALGQLRGLRTQYTEATGRDDFDRFLAPGTRKFFGDEEGGGAAAGGPRKVSTKSDYDALPAGTQYVAPDGSIRTKQ